MSSQNSPTIVTLVLDAIGVQTLEYLLDNYTGRVDLPNLQMLGLGNILEKKFNHVIPLNPDAHLAARVDQASASADSVIGHREMVGVRNPNTYALFYRGFPPEYVAKLEKRIGRKLIFNKMSGGTDAIEQNWQEHEATGSPILYASDCDPIAQFAMNEAVIPIKEQKNIADAALALAIEMGVGITRAIARPYVNDGTTRTRTNNRHDATIPLQERTLLDILYEQGVWTFGVGKIGELVPAASLINLKISKKGLLDPNYGFKFVHPDGKKDTNPYSAQATLNAIAATKAIYAPNGVFIFANFVDTDSVYGHESDVTGSIASLTEFDRVLGTIIGNLDSGDIVVVTADHGMQHKAKGNRGHHRVEPLPLLVMRIDYNNLGDIHLGQKRTLGEVGYVVAQAFKCKEQYVRECKLQGYF